MTSGRSVVPEDELARRQRAWIHRYCPIIVQPTHDIQHGNGFIGAFYSFAKDTTATNATAGELYSCTLYLMYEGESSYNRRDASRVNRIGTFLYRSYNVRKFQRTADINHLRVDGIDLSYVDDTGSEGGAKDEDDATVLRARVPSDAAATAAVSSSVDTAAVTLSVATAATAAAPTAHARNGPQHDTGHDRNGAASATVHSDAVTVRVSRDGIVTRTAATAVAASAASDSTVVAEIATTVASCAAPSASRSSDGVRRPWQAVNTRDFAGEQVWNRGDKRDFLWIYSLVHHYDHTIPYDHWTLSRRRAVVYVNTANHMMHNLDRNPTLAKTVWSRYALWPGNEHDAELFGRTRVPMKMNMYSVANGARTSFMSSLLTLVSSLNVTQQLVMNALMLMPRRCRVWRTPTGIPTESGHFYPIDGTSGTPTAATAAAAVAALSASN
jgi:hypothetical protein